MIIIDVPVIDKCWNLYDSYGEICVHCGCCSKDPLTRYNARIGVLLRRIEHFVTFDGWGADSSLRAIQETNIAHDLKAYRRMLRYYKKRLDEEERKTQAAPVSTELGMIGMFDSTKQAIEAWNRRVPEVDEYEVYG